MSDVLRLKSSITSRSVDGEVVAVDMEGGVYLAVNPTGALLWPLLEAGATEPALIAQLLESFDVDAPRAEAEVAGWLAWLNEHALLER